MQKTLVVGPAWVGDMVMSHSLYMSLHRRETDAVIDVLAPAWSGPILRRMPEVRRHIEMPLGHGELGLVKRYRLGRSLRGERYDRAIVIPRSFKSALIPFFARIPTRTGYKGEMRHGLINDMRPLDRSVLVRTVQRYVALGSDGGDALPPRHIPQPQLRVDSRNQGRLLTELGLSLDRPVAGFMPGAEYGPAKRWSPENFAALARRLVDGGRQVWLIGSNRDYPVCERIVTAANSSAVFNLAGKTRLEDTIDLIALVTVAVTNDSGLMHIAAATGRDVVAIYGSSSPEYTPPLTDRAAIVYLGLECSPCFERECPLGHYRCLEEVTVDKVLSRIEERACQ